MSNINSKPHGASVLVIGSGGREHALCDALARSPFVDRVYCAPGNPGTSEIASNVDIRVDDIEALARFAEEHQISLTVVGPEYPLTLGVVDHFHERGLRIFGPRAHAAQLEGSKSFAKRMMVQAGVPTAEYETFSNLEELLQYLHAHPGPIVLKGDGLHAGKGVFVCSTTNEALSSGKELFERMGSKLVVAEELLDGIEVSFIVATDGHRIVPFACSHDYKRALDGDEGGNTGGMGTVCPTPRVDPSKAEELLDLVIRPVLKAFEEDGESFLGFLYAGLMISPDGEVKVLEYNVRMGDPETQVILPRLESDLYELLLALHDGTELPDVRWKSGAAVCVVAAALGYPDSPKKGDEIHITEEGKELSNGRIYHAGTTLSSEGTLVTAGGRVLGIVGEGDSVESARKRAYEMVGKVSFSGMQYRTDIAL